MNGIINQNEVPRGPAQADTLPNFRPDDTQPINGHGVIDKLTATAAVRNLEPLGHHRHIGHFITDGTLAATQYSRVFHAKRPGDDETDYAVKVNAFDLPRLVDPAMNDGLAMLLRLKEHPGIPKVIEAGTIPLERNPNRASYIVTEEEQGTLADRLPVTSDEQANRVMGLLIGAARAAIYSHEAGYAHNDIKPENILDTDHGGQLIDWDSAFPLGLAPDQNKSITPDYTAPEVASGMAAPSPVSDSYSVAATSIAALSGQARLPRSRFNMEAILDRPNRYFDPAIAEVARAGVDTPPNRATIPEQLAVWTAHMN